MKKSPLLLAALLSTSIASSFAADLDAPVSFEGGSPGLTRAAVKAETIRALKAHEVQFGDVYTPALPAEPSRTRAEVKVETMHALANHEISFGDVVPIADIAGGIPKTRAEVKAQTLVAVRNHEIQTGDLYEPWKVAEAHQAAQERLARIAAKNAAASATH